MHLLSQWLLLGFALGPPNANVALLAKQPFVAPLPNSGFLLALGCLLLGLVVAGLWRKRLPVSMKKRGFVTVYPHAREFLRQSGLSQPEQFFDLPAVIISGHPGRNVAQVEFPEQGSKGESQQSYKVYLKREERVSWGVRLGNLISGFGLTSLSSREAHILEALQREGLPGPRCLAVGEDTRSRAFVMLEAIAGAIPLTVFLRDEQDSEKRRQVIHRLGALLGRLHEAGFEHRDLYSKHVLVHPQTAEIHLVDWQRARRHLAVDNRIRARELAALHATLADVLMSPRERLAFIRVYLQNLPAFHPLASRAGRRWFLGQIHRVARRLLTRRHVREKRQLPPSQVQTWVTLETAPQGEPALCVTAGLQEYSSGAVRDWLGLDQPPPKPPAGRSSVTRRWLTLLGTRQTLLVRRQRQPWFGFLRSWLRSRPRVSPEQRQAALLLRLERHAVPVPRLLAMGQQQTAAGGTESFLLTEPIPDTMRLVVWLMMRGNEESGGVRLHAAAGRLGGRTGSKVAEVLRQAGALLARLHEAACYLPGASLTMLAVQETDGLPAVVLDSVEGVIPRRSHSPAWARNDLVRAQQLLTEAGCGQTDLRRFLTGYHQMRSGGSPEPTGVISPDSRGSINLAPVEGLATSGQAPAGRPTSFPPTSNPHDLVKRESFWNRLLKGCCRLRYRADWPQFVGIDWSERIMTVPVTDRFHSKQGRSTGRWVLSAPPPEPGQPPRKLTVYLKRHHHLPWWQGVLALFSSRSNWSPAFQEWDHLEWARQQGIPVPAVVAAGEFAGPWGKLQSFLAVEELTDMLPLNEAIPLAAAALEPTAFRHWKRGLVCEMARLTRLLHDRRCFHKDLYLCHFYIHRRDIGPEPQSGWQDRVWLIDLHRLAFHPWTWRLWQLKDLAQLLYSSEIVGVDSRDRVHFWRCYRGLGLRRRMDRLLQSCVLFKWSRYRQHNLRRKARLRNEMVHGNPQEMTRT